jgi:hypothetical protein
MNPDNLNILAVPISDLAVLDQHLGGRLRGTLYEVVGAGYEPGIDVVRERDAGKSRWFLVVSGSDPEGKVQREERFEIELGPRFEKVVGIAVNIHVRAYLSALRRELSEIYSEEFTPSADDDVEMPWFAPPRRGPAS